AADRGFWNSANEKAAANLGVEQVVLPGCGRLRPSRAARQKQRWFRRGQGWRAGIEARLSTLKHCFGMQRALYKGEIGFERYVGWCIIAQNLLATSIDECVAVWTCRPLFMIFVIDEGSFQFTVCKFGVPGSTNHQ